MFGQLEVVGFLDDSMPVGETVLSMSLLGPSICMGVYRYRIMIEDEKLF